MSQTLLHVSNIKGCGISKLMNLCQAVHPRISAIATCTIDVELLESHEISSLDIRTTDMTADILTEVLPITHRRFFGPNKTKK